MTKTELKASAQFFLTSNLIMGIILGILFTMRDYEEAMQYCR